MSFKSLLHTDHLQKNESVFPFTVVHLKRSLKFKPYLKQNKTHKGRKKEKPEQIHDVSREILGACELNCLYKSLQSC